MPVILAAGNTNTPPPRQHEDVVDAWAHCTDARCPGYGQQPVKGVRTIVEHTVGSRGGDGIFAMIVENTNEYLRFAEPTDVQCGTCGRDREITLQQRPTYPVITGFPQDGLLTAPKFDPDVRNTEADEKAAAEMAAMRKQMLEMQNQLAKLSGKGEKDA